MQEQSSHSALLQTSGFNLTPKQEEAIDLLTNDRNRHIMLYGGSRSGKTFILLFALIIRALHKKSKHAILRFRFAHVKQAIWYDSLPKVFEALGLVKGRHYIENKSDWFIKFNNGSEIWFGGLDEKERVDKILGNEYSTIYNNEASYLPYRSRLTVLSRLAENSGLPLREYIDCNPPDRSHWTYKIFAQGKEPQTGDPINMDLYASMKMNPKDNESNIGRGYIEDILENLPEVQRKRFLLGEWSDESDGSYYASYINSLEERGRIKNFLLPPNTKIHTAWDIGYSDATAIWFYFVVDNEIYIYDYYENNNKGLEHYISVLKDKRYDYGFHYGPHDLGKHDWGSGKTYVESATRFGLNFKRVKQIGIQDGINAVRVTLPRCRFHETNTLIGLENLRSYRKEYSEKMGEFKAHPLHDFTSHAADAFRYLCVAMGEKQVENFATNAYSFNKLLEHSTAQRRASEEYYG